MRRAVAGSIALSTVPMSRYTMRMLWWELREYFSVRSPTSIRWMNKRSSSGVPFATSSSSGMGQSGTLLSEMAGTGDWQDGQRFSSGASQSDVADWVSGLGLNS